MGSFKKVWFTMHLLWFRIESKIPPRNLDMAYKSTLKTRFLAHHQLSSDIGYWLWWTFGMNQNSCSCLHPCHTTNREGIAKQKTKKKFGKCKVLIRMLRTARTWHDWLLRTLRHSILSKLLKSYRNFQKSICILKVL